MTDSTPYQSQSQSQTNGAGTGAPTPEDEKKKRRRFAAFWWWGAGAAFLLALAAGLYLGGFIGSRTAPKDRIESANVFRIDGVDKQNRKAAFDFIILSDEYTWVIGSSDSVQTRGQTIPDADAATRVITSGLRAALNREADLIAIGMASSEGEKYVEEERANRRSRTLVKWFDTLANPTTPLYVLNLGQYSKSCKNQEDADSSFQRPVIFAGVRAKDTGANLKEALADAMSGKTNLPSPACYSRFDMVNLRP